MHPIPNEVGADKRLLMHLRAAMGYKRLGEDEAVDLILSVLRDGGRPMTTREIQEEVEKRRARCPDSTAIFLNRLRLRGLIKGERSKDRRGWIWWVDD